MQGRHRGFTHHDRGFWVDIHDFILLPPYEKSDVIDLHIDLYKHRNIIILRDIIIEEDKFSDTAVSIDPMGANFLKLFRTFIGNLVVSTNGWIYELYQYKADIPYRVRLQPIKQLTDGIECATLIENFTLDPSLGVILAIGYKGLIALYQIKQTTEPTFIGPGRKYDVLRLSMLSTKYDYKMLIASGKDGLYVTGNSGPDAGTHDYVMLYEYKWNCTLNGIKVPWGHYLPGDKVVFVEHELGYLVVGLANAFIIIYQTLTMMKAFVLQTSHLAVLGKFAHNTLTYVANNGVIECRKMPGSTFVKKDDRFPFVCDQCKTLFMSPMIQNETHEDFTKFVCKDWKDRRGRPKTKVNNVSEATKTLEATNATKVTKAPKRRLTE